MNKSRQNSHQRQKFLRAEEYRDTLKFKVSEIAFPGVFKRLTVYFPSHSCHVVSSEYTQDWEQCCQMSQAFHDIALFERFTELNLFKCHSKLGNL